ncbi:MAG: HupE/UreJ family protein, partial [Gemmatimonadetes bacterium]|nr:HupE/UreJ family protein [Gemmatimonadota bacterium]
MVVRAFVKADDGTLRLVVRVPLTSMRDVDFPVRGPGYVEIEEASELLTDQATIWIASYVALYEESAILPAPTVAGARISLPSDPSFADYDRALAHISAPPLGAGIDLILEQAMLDVVLETPVESADSRFSIDPAWAHLGIRTTTVLRFVTPEGAERVYQYTGNPGRVRLDPRWHQAFLRFVVLGFAHILDGIDHLLFLLCLVIPMRRFWPLVSVVTAFTAAHSITLGASVLGIAPNALWFPPLIETLIAASIVFMALENIVAKTQKRRWMWAFGFGLVHGFGFSFLLRESLQFAGSHLFTSLLGFNLGVEFGQLFALLIMVPGLALLFAKVIPERTGAILVSALVAHTSWHWMAERWGVLTAYNFQRPALDAVFGAALLRWVALLVIVVAVAWGLGEAYR